jgi:hypothetical protein
MMRALKQMCVMTLLSGTLVVPTGCSTGSPGLFHVTIFVPNHPKDRTSNGWFANAIIFRINDQQRAQLRAQSPQTWETVQRNDAAVAAAKNAAPASAAPAGDNTSNTGGTDSAPAATADKPTPLMVDDIKAMASSGIKEDVICDEITQSQAVYTQRDIDAVQQTSPPIDPRVIACMKQHMNS